MLLCAPLAAYFAYHTVYGRHGLGARSELVARAVTLSQRLRTLETMRLALERDIALLQDKGLDPDLLDEAARSMLGFARHDDLIVLDR